MLKATILGNFGNDPEMKYNANGSPFLRFNVASSYRSRNAAGEWEERTKWIRVTVFGQRAESLGQYLCKGSHVYVEDRLEARPSTDQQGQVRAELELIASKVDEGGCGQLATAALAKRTTSTLTGVIAPGDRVVAGERAGVGSSPAVHGVARIAGAPTARMPGRGIAGVWRAVAGPGEGGIAGAPAARMPGRAVDRGPVRPVARRIRPPTGTRRVGTTGRLGLSGLTRQQDQDCGQRRRENKTHVTPCRYVTCVPA